MSLLLNKYLSQIDNKEEIEFYSCSINLENGEELFAQVGQVDDGIYILKDPVKIIREYSDMTTYSVNFDMYCPFSDDRFSVLQDSSIVSINYLSNRYLSMYKDAVDQINKMLSKKANNSTGYDKAPSASDEVSIEEYFKDDNSTIH